MTSLKACFVMALTIVEFDLNTKTLSCVKSELNFNQNNHVHKACSTPSSGGTRTPVSASRSATRDLAFWLPRMPLSPPVPPTSCTLSLSSVALGRPVSPCLLSFSTACAPVEDRKCPAGWSLALPPCHAPPGLTDHSEKCSTKA